MTDIELNQLIASRIRAIRKRKDLKQSEVAQMLDMNEKAYQRIEQGATMISVVKLVRIAEVFDKNVSQFVTFGELVR